MTKPIYLEKENIIFDNKFARVWNDDVLFPGEIPGTYFRMKWKCDFCVAVIARLDNGKYHFVRPYRYAREEFVTEIVKGMGQKGKTALETAKAELKEEAGLISELWTELGVLYTDPGLMDMPVYLFEAKDCVDTGIKEIEESEVFEESMVLTKSEIISKIKSGEIDDCITIAGIYRSIFE